MTNPVAARAVAISSDPVVRVGPGKTTLTAIRSGARSAEQVALAQRDVVDAHVQPAVPIQRGTDGGVDGHGVGDVDPGDQRVPRRLQLGRRLRRPGPVPVGRDDGVARREEAAREREADPARGAGDEDDLRSLLHPRCSPPGTARACARTR
ncbi:hypothetical protein GCM10023403_51130 [Pseudonocardia benzenivorans]